MPDNHDVSPESLRNNALWFVNDNASKAGESWWVSIELVGLDSMGVVYPPVTVAMLGRADRAVCCKEFALALGVSNDEVPPA